MNTYLYIAEPPLETVPDQGGTFNLGEQDGISRYMTREPINAADYPDNTVTLVGEWDKDGRAFSVIHLDNYRYFFRDFRNDPDSFGTDDLDFIHWQGHKQRAMQDQNQEVVGRVIFPADDQAFQLKMEHDEITEGTHQGHGWKCTMLSEDPHRDITARAIGIYSDPECTQYLYTTGAFIMTDIPAGEDEEGNPVYIQRPQTVCPPGQLKATREPVYFALLLGSLQEGKMALPAEQDSITRNFWQGTGGGIGEWAPAVAYVVDDEVTYEGSSYKCLQAHTSQPGWEPPNVPALWELLPV